MIVIRWAMLAPLRREAGRRAGDSHILADAIERGLGRVECVALTRQYLHLSPLVDVA